MVGSNLIKLFVGEKTNQPTNDRKSNNVENWTDEDKLLYFWFAMFVRWFCSFVEQATEQRKKKQNKKNNKI